MFETSKDFLNLALGLGGFFALFCLGLVFAYTAGILRRVLRAIKTVDGAFEAVKKFFEAVGEKIANASALGKFATDVIKLVSDVKDVKEEFTNKPKKKK